MAGITIAVALVIAGIGAIVISSGYDEPREMQAVGRNLPVNEGARNPLDLSAQNSPTIARNPVAEDNLVLANRVDAPSYSCSVATSVDGGGSWNQTVIPAPSRDAGLCYAPDVSFGADGTLYLAFVTLKGRANAPDAAWLSTSTDGGRTLSRPTRTPLGKLAFQVRVTADTRNPRRVYLTWLAASEVGLYKFSEPGNPIQAIRSENSGRTWTDPVQVNDDARVRALAPAPAVGPEGELYVLYLDLGDDRLDYEGGHRGRGGPPYDGMWQLVLARSTDRGESWTESVVEDEIVPTERFVAFTPPFPSIAIDGERVYAAFQNGALGDADVNLWSLPPGESSWKGPLRVNDTRERDGTTQYLPQLAVAPDGRLDVVYLDRRDDNSDVLNEVSLQSSFDDGSSFRDRIELSDQASSSRIGFGSERGLPDLGSRLALVSSDTVAYAVWPDTRAGTRRSGKQDLARGVVGVTDPQRLAGWLEALLRWGGIVLILLGAAALATTIARSTRPT
ncbi:MAG: hypothetical protein ACR2GL_00625 [Thermoleophilaceae bacterium]